MKRNIANALTLSRILCGVCLLFFDVFSLPFYILYLFCGLSDMLDGFVARKTKSVSEFGSKLDSIADIVFLTCASIKILPEINLPFWLWLWILIIFVAKSIGIILNFIKNKTIAIAHNKLNKACGLLLFLMPLTFSFIKIEYSTIPICILASIGAIRDLHNL
ncbi:MAG: CDP-alcohol phosphatidyltransferase family protein [Bacteroidales bacterium]|nr:CDP-alcohol phosphatidyltransferase family protein [Bacteroidales bacterium]